MKTLVTGGAGFIGSALVRRLLAEGHTVVSLDDMSRGQSSRLPWSGTLSDFHSVVADVRDPEAVASAMQGCDLVVHAAYLQGTQTFYAEPRQVLDVAVRGMLNVLTACEVTGCSQLVLLSSSEAYQVASVVPTPETIPLTVPDPLNPRYSYGGGKIACELMAQAWARTGVLERVVTARPHNIFGPDMGREHVIPEFCIRMNRLTAEHPSGVIPFPIQGTGAETRSFCYIDDCIGQLMLLISSAQSGIWNVGTMDERTIADVAHGVAVCYGREVKVEPGTLPSGSPPRRLPDTAKITALGAGPVTDFAYGLDLTASWYQAHG